MDDIWHFPRPELAKQYLTFFDTGISNSLVLFAMRRTGKTEMLIKDLAPAAEADNYHVVYASFWQSPLTPTAVLLYALERSLTVKTFSERLHDLLTTPVTKLKLSGQLLGVKGEAELNLGELSATPPPDLLLYLDDLLLRISKRKKRLLLLLDEVQELAIEQSNRPLIAALRTSLDQYKHRISVVFTGSSQEGLTRMFSDREAPFFHFATQIQLPLLGEAFVRHIVKTFNGVTKRKISVDNALAAYEDLHRNPFYFRKVVEIMLVNPNADFDTAIRQLRAKLPIEQGYTAAWIKLRSLDQEILSLLASGEKALFAVRPREGLAETLGIKTPSPATIQTSIRRLQALRLVTKGVDRGVYEFDDPEFAEWVRVRSLPKK